jgi:hypothetical protein
MRADVQPTDRSRAHLAFALCVPAAARVAAALVLGAAALVPGVASLAPGVVPLAPGAASAGGA